MWKNLLNHIDLREGSVDDDYTSAVHPLIAETLQEHNATFKNLPLNSKMTVYCQEQYQRAWYVVEFKTREDYIQFCLTWS